MSMNPTTPLHGGQLSWIAERFGVSASELLDFSANINPDGPPPEVLVALHKAVDHLATLGQYPHLEQTPLRQAIANHTGVQADEVVTANGFVPLLDATLKALSIRKCLLPVPAFNEYRSALERAGVEVDSYAVRRQTDFQYQADELLTLLEAGGHDAILLANPQNPSGVITKSSQLLSLVEESATRNVCVLLDEAFIDYIPEESMLRYVHRFTNLIVFRSLTKFYGMPGMRVAYAVAGSSLANAVRNQLAPWPITTLAAEAAITSLSCTSYAEHIVSTNEARRNDLSHRLGSLGLSISASAANFLLLRFPSIQSAEQCWKELIATHGIVLRHCGNFEGLSGNHLRCAVRGPHDNLRLVHALTAIAQQNVTPGVFTASNGSLPPLS